MDKEIVTFRIDKDTWDRFKALYPIGMNYSSALRELVSSRVAEGDQVVSMTEKDVQEIVDLAVKDVIQWAEYNFCRVAARLG